MRFGQALSSAVGEWLHFRTCEQHFKRQKSALTNNKTQARYSMYWLGRLAFVCASKHTAVMSLMPPVVGQQRTGAHPGIFVHFLKTQCDKEGAKTRERPFTPLPESCLKWCQHLPSVEGGHYKKQMIPPAWLMLLHSHWRVIWIISHVIPPYHHQLPSSIPPFPAVWSLLQQITVSVIGKAITEKSKQRQHLWLSFCISLLLSLLPVEPHWLQLMPCFDCEESKYTHKMALCNIWERGPGGDVGGDEAGQFWREPHSDL